MALLRSKSQTGFRYLYDHYADALFGQVRSIIPDANVAGDVLQEVFLKIWRNIDQYDPAKGKLFTWMMQITRSISIDMLRSRDWRNSQRNNSLTDDHIQVAGTVQYGYSDAGLRRTVQALKTEYRELVELSYFQGYTQEEISRMLNLPLGTVKTRLRTALVQLRQKIGN
ncbi:RNA polymerase sigma factor [Flavihumibacter petaseus]|uniref:RNA polymerase sigma factor n=1 Tax=Flavihumibacter petaseus TaxID=549295 RepID=UPI001FE0D39D|nr:sigma-70 family RNA polymerase sigma factor [Flavihumibacter petaseus]